MLKKNLIIIGAAVVLLAAILLPPVRAAAESALSVFRVEDTHTISITVTDLQEIAEYMQAHRALFETGSEDSLSQAMDRIRSQVKPLGSAAEFDAFTVNLPSALKAETPSLSAIDAQTETVTLDTAKLNAALSELGATALVDDGLSGTAVTVTTPPAFFAEYSDVLLIATQTVSVDAPAAALNNLKTALLSIPAIPEDLRAQLLPIDPKTRDVYLPVIEGLGRTTDLGGSTGYIYATGDLAQVLSLLPQTSDSDVIGELQEKNAAAVVWTKNGVLYCLIGDKSDSEMSQIARTVR